MNPAGGCLPIVLTMGLLIPMYSVFSQGLTNYDPSAMWHVFGINLFPNIVCPSAPSSTPPGTSSTRASTPFAFGVNWGIPEPATTGLIIAGFGISILAIISSLSQLVASRMTLPPHDPKTADDQNVKLQRQMAYFLPLISILWGSSLPAGLFLYWITSTLIQIIQQYFILGWGGMFPLFGWFPEFARNHKPRYPVQIPAPKPPAPGQPPSAAGALDNRRPRPIRALDDQAQSNPNRATRETTLT